MAINSIARFIIVFPVPVTAFNQTVAKDIRIRAVETIRNTGKADCIKSSPWPYTGNYFFFKPLPDYIAHHGIAGSGKGPGKHSKKAKYIAHGI